ncbi:uncharacterized protein [Engystomops pustulosus]|uniref:uncharacterized protein isoform X3 n=1 Tax=Engystomops pustulosus TaxID=76066 RepID=UPI003AFB51BE
MSVLDFVSDPNRDEALIGLQYIVEMKMAESDKSIVKCLLCNVKGHFVTMKEHLVGTNHIKLYMEKYYFSVLQSLKKSGHHKSQLNKLLKDYAKEIERSEGTKGIKDIGASSRWGLSWSLVETELPVEYVSATDMNREQDRMTEAERLEFRVDQKKFQPLDRRQIALSYSEKFQISSREEATIVLNLTQQLSDQLEQYFLKYKELNHFPPNVPERSQPKHAATQGLMNKMQWHTEEPSSSSMGIPSVHSFDSVPLKLDVSRGVKRKPEVFEEALREADELPESSSSLGFHKRKRTLNKEMDQSSSVQSSFPHTNDVGFHLHSLAEVSSSYSPSIPDTNTHINIPKEILCVPETSGREKQMMRKDVPQAITQNISKIEDFQESKSINDSDTAETNKGDERNGAVPGPSSSNTNYSYEPASEKPSTNYPQGRTSKTLSPDILQLLKGKDAHTVTNILRTLSPFYPALQEVNLEILAQVLVNTGALD